MKRADCNYMRVISTCIELEFVVFANNVNLKLSKASPEQLKKYDASLQNYSDVCLQSSLRSWRFCWGARATASGETVMGVGTSEALVPIPFAANRLQLLARARSPTEPPVTQATYKESV